VSVGVAHSAWGLMWVVLALFFVRCLIRRVGTPGRCGPRA
jgi:hypothetical protein